MWGYWGDRSRQTLVSTRTVRSASSEIVRPHLKERDKDIEREGERDQMRWLLRPYKCLLVFLCSLPVESIVCNFLTLYSLCYHSHMALYFPYTDMQMKMLIRFTFDFLIKFHR